MRAHRFRKDSSSNDYNLLEGVALNASADARTLTLRIGNKGEYASGGVGTLYVNVKYTYSAAATVTCTPTLSYDGGTEYFSIPSRSVSSGASTVSALVDTIASGASRSITVPYDVAGATHIKLVFAGTGSPAEGDLISVQAIGFEV